MRLGISIAIVSVLALTSGAATACPGEQTSQSGSELGDIRIKHKAWKNSFFLWASIGAEMKAEVRGRKRRWWCAWICQTEGWKKWRGDLQMTTSYFDLFGDLIGQEEHSGNHVHEIKSKWSGGGFVVSIGQTRDSPVGRGGLPVETRVSTPDAEGVRSEGEGSAQAWHIPAFPHWIWSRQVHSSLEVARSVSYSGCVGAGTQPP